MSQELVYLPLGGAGEIGMNMYLYGLGLELDHEWLMVDCGITFADGAMAGVDVITPDPAFIAERRDMLKGLVITHAHEDHVGAVPHLWERLRCPIYATPFAAAFIKRKLTDEGTKGNVPIHIIQPGGRAEIGPFEVEFVPVTHSIPEACSLIIRSHMGEVVHTGDFKFDPDPVIGSLADEKRLGEVGDGGVLAMVCDSTNIFSEGRAGSEASLLENLTRVISECRERVVVACFASNVARLLTIARAAEANGRSVVLVGRSLERITSVAASCGYLDDAPPLLGESDLQFLPRENTLIIATGCQGEPRAALSRMAAGTHPRARIDKGDTVLFSSRMIPGNELSIARLHNELIRMGVEVISERDSPIHVSGHPAREEVRRMYQLIRPKIAIPMHGETIHLKENVRLAAKEMGVKHTPLVENGSMLRLAGGKVEIVDNVPVGRLALDGNRLVPLEGEVVKGRNRALWNGTVTVSVVVDGRGRLLTDPKVSTTGLIDAHEGEIELEAADAAAAILDDLSTRALRDDDALAEAVRVAVRRYFRRRLDKKPVTTVHLLRV